MKRPVSQTTFTRCSRRCPRAGFTMMEILVATALMLTILLAVAWVFGMRVSVEGPVPEGRFLLVSNHLSYADVVLVLGAILLHHDRFVHHDRIAGGTQPVHGLADHLALYLCRHVLLVALQRP